MSILETTISSESTPEVLEGELILPGTDTVIETVRQTTLVVTVMSASTRFVCGGVGNLVIERTDVGARVDIHSNVSSREIDFCGRIIVPMPRDQRWVACMRLPYADGAQQYIIAAEEVTYVKV